MPECCVRIIESAWADIDRIADFYLMRVGASSAERITDKLLDTIQLLEEQPFMGALHPDPILAKNGFRKILCQDYVCVYKVVANEVFIYRIVNGRTDYPKLFY